jgi:hypothetical protein
MAKRILSIFIRWSIVKKYFRAAYRPTASGDFLRMNADIANYWVIYIFTGKSDKQIENELDEHQED